MNTIIIVVAIAARCGTRFVLDEDVRPIIHSSMQVSERHRGSVVPTLQGLARPRRQQLANVRAVPQSNEFQSSLGTGPVWQPSSLPCPVYSGVAHCFARILDIRLRCVTLRCAAEGCRTSVAQSSNTGFGPFQSLGAQESASPRAEASSFSMVP